MEFGKEKNVEQTYDNREAGVNHNGDIELASD